MAHVVTFRCAAGAGAFIVQRLHVREALAGVPEYRVELLSAQADIAPDTLLGTPAAIALSCADGTPPRWFHGHVTRLACSGLVRTPAFGGGLACRYEAVLRPGLWFLTQRADCRIHRGQRLADLIASRLADAGVMSLRMDVGDTERRDYVVQYRESDLHFVSRLVEHIGAAWWVEHAADAHRLVITDRLGDAAAGEPVHLVPSEHASVASLRSFALVQAVRPGAFAGTDYHYVTPRTSLATRSALPADHVHADGEWFDAPLDALTPAWADTYARLRMEALACRQLRARGSTRSLALRAGGRLLVSSHPVDAMNGDWLVTRLDLRVDNPAAQTGVDAVIDDMAVPAEEDLGVDRGLDPAATASDGPAIARFEAVPAGTPWRPERRTPRPSIPGVQTARVLSDFRDDVAAAGGPSDPPLGARMARVRVAFPWDRRADASCWARVSQPWAGRGFGFQNMPRIGDEVLVQFVEGDPDRPVVVGRVHNADRPPPYALPRHAAVTGLRTASLDAQGHSIVGRFNELRFDDAQGDELVYLQAQRDMDARVGGDLHVSVDGHAHRVVTGDMLDAVGGSRHLRVDGAVEAHLGGDVHASITGDLHLTASTGGVALAAAHDVHVRAGTRLVLEAVQGVTLRCGASFVEVDPSGVRIDGPLVSLKCGGTAATGPGADAADARIATPSIRSDGSRPPTSAAS